MSQPTLDTATPHPPARGRRPSLRQAWPPGPAIARGARVAATSSPRRVRGYLCRLVLVLGRGLRRTRRGEAREPRFVRVARERRHGGATLRDEGRALPLSKAWASDSRWYPGSVDPKRRL